MKTIGIGELFDLERQDTQADLSNHVELCSRIHRALARRYPQDITADALGDFSEDVCELLREVERTVRRRALSPEDTQE